MANSPGASWVGDDRFAGPSRLPSLRPVERGMRIAQLLVAPGARVAWERVETLAETARGAGGFGHTGQK